MPPLLLIPRQFCCFHSYIHSTDTFNTSNAPNTNNYWSIACSSSGQYAVAGTNLGHGIWVSSDFGLTWAQTRAPVYNTYVAVISDYHGQNLAALMSNGTIYTSNDGGAYWEETISTVIFNSLAGNNNGFGSFLIASELNGYLYSSEDYGATFTQIPSFADTWTCVSVNADNTYLMAGAVGEYLYYEQYTPVVPDGSGDGGDGDSKDNTPIIIGAVVGGVVLITLLVGVYVYFYADLIVVHVVGTVKEPLV